MTFQNYGVCWQRDKAVLRGQTPAIRFTVCQVVWKLPNGTRMNARPAKKGRHIKRQESAQTRRTRNLGTCPKLCVLIGVGYTVIVYPQDASLRN